MPICFFHNLRLLDRCKSDLVLLCSVYRSELAFLSLYQRVSEDAAIEYAASIHTIIDIAVFVLIIIFVSPSAWRVAQ